MKKSSTLHRAIILIISVLLLTTPACKKNKGEDEDPLKEGTISFKANGEQKTFEIASFNTYKEGEFYVCFLYGGTENSGAAFVTLKITSSQPVAAINYVSDTGAGREIEFRDADSKTYSGINETYTAIKVDQVSDDAIRGTFSGTLSGGDAANVTITEGKFNCRKLM